MSLVPDPILPLAFSVHSGPGVYAVLLGSGVSRAAGIPTGWEVTLDLISKLASAVDEEEQARANPVTWFTDRYEEEPDYSRVVERLSGSPEDRQRLLAGYFEPDEEDREESRKLPTEGHQALAKLASKGYVKVILTTNFDKLMERTLDAEGVTPTVVSTPDQAEGAPPLQHTGCTIIKVNGDYLDARIKNTPAELASYDERTNALLDKVFDEYGLVVCGWSGTYDTALIEAFQRSRSRRFTTYWASYHEPSVEERELVEFAQGRVIETDGADPFFLELLEKIEALEEHGGPHPLSAPLAVATTKRYLADDRYRIRLHDLVREETEKLYAEVISEEEYPIHDQRLLTNRSFDGRLTAYRNLTDVLLNVVATGCYWDSPKRSRMWGDALERLANVPQSSGLEVALALRRYPAMLVLYSSGIAALAGGHTETLRALFSDARVRNVRGEAEPAVLELHTWEFARTFEEYISEYIQPVPIYERGDQPPQLFYMPFSEHLFRTLREPLREYLPSDENYVEAFDVFEYLLGLVFVHERRKHRPEYALEEGWGPVGLFAYRRRSADETRLFSRLDLSHLFDGSSEELDLVRASYDGFVRDVYRRRL
ncbi:MAG: SIR2 family protein [Rubrobacteraceae bacterium]